MDTPERWQGLERKVMVAVHPLSGVVEPSTFDLDTGRLCVMASRHQVGLILVGRDHIAATLPAPRDQVAFETDQLVSKDGCADAAREAAMGIGDPEGQARVLDLLAPIDAPEPRDTSDEDELFRPDGPPRQPLPDVEVVEGFLRWFGGRRDLYARQWYDDRRRRNGYRPVEAPLTAAVVRNHLAGRITVGQYLLFPDATTSFGVIDLDLDASALADLRSTRGEARPLDHAPLATYSRRLLEAGKRLGLPLFPEDSGGRGVHLWLFIEPRRPARAVRALLAQVVELAGSPPAEVGLELFPKQDRNGPRGLSSLVKLPLGVHQASGRRCPLLDDTLQPLDDAQALSILRAAPNRSVDDLLGRRLVPLPAPESGPTAGPPPALEEVGSPRTLAEALRAVPAGPPEREACERMLAGCPILGAFVERAYGEHRLDSDQARALIYSVGLVGPGTLAKEALASANASTRELERVHRGLPSPIGCSRLRKLAPELAERCRCPRGPEAQPYPSPALLAVGSVGTESPGWKPFAAWLDPAEAAVGGPLDSVREALDRIDQRLDRLERREP